MAGATQARVIVLGSGPAGATAAIYAARAMLEPVMIAGLQPGGQLTITTDVENYPGFAGPIQGPWLMEQMQAQAEHVGTRMIQDTIASVDLGARPFTLIGDSGVRYRAEALIIATGAQAKWLGLESEERFKGFGVSACATCDGFFFRGKQLRLAENRKIALRYDSVVDEILGRDDPKGVEGIRVRSLEDGATETLAIDGLFVAIGHSPATEIFRGQLDMDGEGYIRTAPDSTRTSVPGVFAAGDVKDRIFRQAVTAAGLGCMAALEAERFLSGAH
jgi:thioredoxin reductase (NADPH)